MKDKEAFELLKKDVRRINKASERLIQGVRDYITVSDHTSLHMDDILRGGDEHFAANFEIFEDYVDFLYTFDSSESVSVPIKFFTEEHHEKVQDLVRARERLGARMTECSTIMRSLEDKIKKATDDNKAIVDVINTKLDEVRGDLKALSRAQELIKTTPHEEVSALIKNLMLEEEKLIEKRRDLDMVLSHVTAPLKKEIITLSKEHTRLEEEYINFYRNQNII